MSERITSIHNQRIKMAAKLRNRDERDSQQRIIIDGAREISRAIDAGVELLDLFVCDETLRAEARQIVQQADELGIACCAVSPAVLAKLAFGERNEGIVATARPPKTSLEQLRIPNNPLVVVLADVEKPGNIGAVVRTADACGANAVIVADGSTDLFNPNSIRASLGSIFAMPIVAASHEKTLDWLRKNHFQIYAARVESSVLYTDVALNGPTGLVLGNEAIGLGEEWSASDIQPISLPLLGVADSLNVSVSAGVLLYEALRQRRIAC